MSKGWQLVIHEPSLRALLAARAKERVVLFRALDRLVANPYTKGNFTEHDETGRPVEVLVAKPWTISFWPDSFVKELRVVRIAKLRS